MPEPFPNPAILTSRASPSPPPRSSRANAVFSTVSVVRMAWAASWNCVGSAASDASRSGRAAASFSTGRGTPMIPVEEGNTSSARQPNRSAAAAQVARAALRPASPAAQLALPALMATTRTCPPVAFKCSLSIISGAAITRLEVNAAAALAGASATIIAKSVRPLAFSPALVAPKRKPKGMAFWGRSLM